MNRRVILLLCVTSCLLFACSEIIEEPIDSKTVVLLAPQDQAHLDSYTPTFWWEAVEGALQYNIQIVSPDFNAANMLVVDSVINSNKFTISLKPGTYQWRVRAMNGSSATGFTTRSLTIDTSSLANQQVQLSSPANNSYTNNVTPVFKWQELFGATSYRFQVDTLSFAGGSYIQDTLINQEFIQYSFTNESAFQWRVRAENDTAQSGWSTVYTVTYDATPPDSVTVTAPANGITIQQPVLLQWNAVASADRYKVYAYKSDTVTLFTAFPVTTKNLSYSFTSGAVNEKVFWQVSAIDKAGNEGTRSSIRNFRIQP